MTREEALKELVTMVASEKAHYDALLMASVALSQECVGSTQKHVGNALDMRCDDVVSRKAVRDILSNARLGESKLAHELDKLPSVAVRQDDEQPQKYTRKWHDVYMQGWNDGRKDILRKMEMEITT